MNIISNYVKITLPWTGNGLFLVRRLVDIGEQEYAIGPRPQTHCAIGISIIENLK